MVPISPLGVCFLRLFCLRPHSRRMMSGQHLSLDCISSRWEWRLCSALTEDEASPSLFLYSHLCPMEDGQFSSGILSRKQGLPRAYGPSILSHIKQRAAFLPARFRKGTEQRGEHELVLWVEFQHQQACCLRSCASVSINTARSRDLAPISEASSVG